MSYQYIYKGKNDLHLPTHNLNVKGGDEKTIYTVEGKINSPLFEEVKGKEHKK